MSTRRIEAEARLDATLGCFELFLRVLCLPDRGHRRNREYYRALDLKRACGFHRAALAGGDQ